MKNVCLFFTSCCLIIGLKGVGQTNNYFGTTGVLNTAVWSTLPAGPYTSALVTTGGAIINFGNPATLMGASITVKGINATSNVTVASAAGTISNFSDGIIPIDVSTGITLDFASQNFSGSVTGGYIKNGSGVFAFIGNTYGGGFTLNAGTLIARSENSMGSGVSNTLNLNGGILASNATRDFSGKYPVINIGGDIQFGDKIGLANDNANLTFTNNMSLGMANRTLSLGNAGINTFGGSIAGSNGITFTNNINGTGLFDITNTANTFTGSVNINGGQNRFAADGSFGAAGNNIIIDGGRLRTDASFIIGHAMQIGTTAGTGINVFANTLTISGVISDKSAAGSFTKTGAGTLVLTASNIHTGTTYIAGGTLQLNRAGGNTIPITNNAEVSGGTLQISTDQTLNNLSLVTGNLIVDNGITLTINGTLDYFQPASITLTGTGKIVYGPAGTLKYSGGSGKIVTLNEWPSTGGPVNVNAKNSAGVILPTILSSRTITGSLILTSGTFTIGTNVLLDLNGASVVNAGGYISGTGINSSTSDLTVRGNTGGIIVLPTNGNIGLRNVTIGDTRTLTLNGADNLTLSGNLFIDAGASFDNGGESQLLSSGTPTITISGKFINRDKDNFTGGSGAITAGVTTTLNAGCTIEYALAGNQVVTSRPDYKNLTLSGTGIKNPGSGFNPFGTVKITGSAIFDCTGNNVGDNNTNLTMDGGRLIVSTGSTEPGMNGVYNLTGGVIQFNGAGTETIRTQTYQNIEVSGTSVGNSNGNITLNSNGTFTVKTGGVFTINDDGIVGPSGTQTVTVENGAIFKCGDQDGFSGNLGAIATSVNQTIENVILHPGSTIDYSREGDQVITNAHTYQHLTISGNTNIKKAPLSMVLMGNFTKSGTSIFAHNNGTVVFSNSVAEQNYICTSTAPVNFYNLINSNTYNGGNGLNILGNMGIVNSLNISANSKLNLSTGGITLISTAVNTGRIAEIPATASINYGTGRFTVERYYPNNNPLTRRAWRLVTTPLTETGTIYDNWQLGGAVYSAANAHRGTLITGPQIIGNGLDFTPTNGYSLKKYNGTNLIPVADTHTPLSPSIGTGYFLFVRGDRNLILTNPANSDYTTLSSTGKVQTGSLTLNVPNDFTLIGNPYASPIDFNLIDKSFNIFKHRFYVWDPLLNQVGGYVVMEDLSSPGIFKPTSPYAASSQNNYIQSSQAFFVVRELPVAASITIAETNKAPNYNPAIFRPFTEQGNSTAFIKTNLFLLNADSSKTLADGTLAEFNDGYSNAVDIADALKFGNVHETFCLKRNNQQLAVERRAPLTENDTLFFQLNNAVRRNYQFEIVAGINAPQWSAYLEDSYLKSSAIINLQDTTVINFTVTVDAASAVANRFRLVFKNNGSPLPLTFISVKASRQNNNIGVEWAVENEVNISKYDIEKSVDGEHFLKVNTVAARGFANTMLYNWLDVNAVQGNNFYRIKSIDNNGDIFYSRTVKINFDNEEGSIAIYANPITNGHIDIQFLNQPKGIYQVQLFNNLGQLILTKNIIHPGGTVVTNISAGKGKIVAGTYHLQVIKPDKTILDIQVFVR